jgi:hypothetical protein
VEITEYPNKASARLALDGAQREAANRFFRGATSKSRNFKVTETANGRVQLEFFSPARTEGYGKRYVQLIGANGEIVEEFKETLGPEGLLETKWVHNG